LGEDVDAAVGVIVRLAELELRLAAAEERLEVALELLVDDGEGCLEALADVRLELVDASGHRPGP
jgi:hypothetical protein